MYGNTEIIVGDVLSVLRTLPDSHFHCVVTSPPYWGLRDYGTATWEGGDPGCDHKGKPFATKANINANCGTGTDRKNAEDREFFRDTCGKCGARRIDSQIGLESTPEEFVAKMVEVFREVRRVLRDDGVCFVNMGDAFDDKQLLGMPWRVALALQADGWWLRQDIIWAKPNPMPESVRDRCTKAHEYIFLLTKSARYYWDAEAVKEQPVTPGLIVGDSVGCWHDGDAEKKLTHGDRRSPECNGKYVGRGGRNLRSVWSIATQAFSEAHFATFPTAIPERCIRAGTSERGCCPECGSPWERVVDVDYIKNRPSAGNDPRSKDDDRLADARGIYGSSGWRGNNLLREARTAGWRPTCECCPPDVEKVHWEKLRSDERRRYWTEREWTSLPPTVPCRVLEPFAGSGTTPMVAAQLGRDAVGIELNPEYAEMARRRIAAGLRPNTARTDGGEAGLFDLDPTPGPR